MSMFLQFPFIVLSLLLLAIGLACEFAVGMLDVELPLLAETMGLSADGVEALLYAAAIAMAGLGIVFLRLLPRALAPMGDVAPSDRSMVDPLHPGPIRVAHVNDPLQSVYVAVILIAGVLLFSSVS